MKHLKFIWHSGEQLGDFLSGPIYHMSIRTAQHGRPISVTLWRSDAGGLRVQSKMHDLDDRREIGVLEFTSVASPHDDEVVIDLPEAFKLPARATKLVAGEAGATAESGIMIEAGDGQRIVIVAGAYPFSLAVSGTMAVPYAFEPEYPLATHTHAEIN